MMSVLLAKADTITTQDSRAWNGTLTTIQNGILTLTATFPTGDQQLNFGVDYLRAIEFNNLTYNPGANPIKLLSKPEPGKPIPATIYWQKKKTERAPLQCEDISSNPPHIVCQSKSTLKPAQKPEEIDEKDVLRIVVGSQ